MKIPRPASDGSSVVGLGKVFVLFDTKESAMKTHTALHGRLFDNKSVVCTYMDQDRFLTGDLSDATAQATQF